MNPYRRVFRAPRRAPALAAPILAALAAAFAAAGAGAQDPEVLGRFQDWYATTYVENGARTCYATSEPTGSEGDYTRRDPVYVHVTLRAGGEGVVSVEAGYPYREGSEAEARIENETFRLFTDGETAWTFDADDDRAMIAAMRRGARMVVTGVSQRGTETTDTYSLLGLTRALEALAEACGP